MPTRILKDKTHKLARVRHPQVLNTPVIDYTYDALGQLTAQLEPGKNKYFDYDVTGKVTRVYRNAAKTDLLAEYLYDEFGKRIRQSVYNAQGEGEYTEYIRDVAGNEVASYYYDAGPEIMRLAEQPIYGATRIGVVRQPRGQEAGAQLYELNDQLDNTRVVFQQPHTNTYLLTMEDGNTDEEAKNFPTPDAYTYKQVRTADAAMQASPHGQGYSMDLFAQVGPGKKLAVSPGDHVVLEAYAAYSSGNGPILGRPQPTGPALPRVSIVLGAGTLLTQPSPREATGSRPLPAWQQLLSQVSVGIAIPLFSHPKAQPLGMKGSAALTMTNTPNDAALRYTLRLVRDQSVVRTGAAIVTPDAEGRWEKLSLDVAIDVEEPAELEIWVENQDKMHVYFDDLSVEHRVGPIVQENHFYAYGHRNEGLSWTRQHLRGYGHGYQGQYTRFDEETGYDNFELRQYDSRIGRWLSPDPMGQFNSPYVGMGNDPGNNIDPTGGLSGDPKTNLPEVTVTATLPGLGATGGLMLWDSYLRTSYYKPMVTQFVDLYQAGSISDGTYSMLRYQAQKATKMRLSQMGKKISETKPFGKPLPEQKALAEAIASGEKSLSKGALNTRVSTTRLAIGTHIVGGALVITGVAMSVHHVYTASDKGLAISQEAGGWAGSLAGAEAGAALGGAIGTAFGGVGAVPGAFIGGLVGGAAGYYGGYSAGQALYNGGR